MAAESGPLIVQLTRCTLDLDRGVALPRDGSAPVRLTTRERELLRHLAERAPSPVSRDELLSRVWGYADSVLSRACDNAVHRVRVKIEADPAAPDHLLTAHGSGYQLVLLGAPRPEPPEDPTPPAPAAPDLVLGPVRIELGALRVDGPAGTTHLTANEAALLRCLMKANGAVVDRPALVRQVWGHLPDHGRRIDNAVSRLRAKIEPDPGSPRYLRTAVRGGYQLVVDAEASAPAAVARDLPPLPLAVDRRFGPPDQVDAVVAQLGQDRLVTLVGPGGIGKTRLALAVGHQLEAAGRAVAWADAVDVATVGGLCSAIAVAVRGRVPDVGPSAVDPVDTVADALRGVGQPLVLVLNDVERVPSAADVVAKLLAGMSDLAILCTSRVLLRTRGERAVPVDPLSSADAVALFADRAVRPPTPGEQADVEALVGDLDGLPLAIELAAARTAVLSVSALRTRAAQQPLELLVSRDTRRPERHRSLRGAIDASVRGTSGVAQRVLARLAVFHGSFGADAAEVVAALSPPDPDVVDVLEELADCSLLRVAPNGRASLLVPVREYAGEVLAPGERTDAELRHGGFYARPLGDADGKDEEEVRLMWSLDLPNRVAALDRAIVRGDGAVAAGAFAGACATWLRTGPVRMVVEVADRVLACAVDGRARAEVEWLAAIARTYAGDLEGASAHLLTARALAVESADLALLFEVVSQIAVVAHRRGHWAAFARTARDAHALAERIGRPTVRCRALVRVARAFQEEGDLLTAVDLLDEAQRLADAHGGPTLRGTVARRQAMVAIEDGRLGDLERLMQISGALGGDSPMQLHQASMIHRLAGRTVEALAAGTEAVEGFGRTGDRQARSIALTGVAWDRLDLGQLDRAEATFREALDEAEAATALIDRARALQGLALVAAERGDLAAAEAMLRDAIRAMPDPTRARNARSLLGWMLVQQGRLAEGVHALEESARLAGTAQRVTALVLLGDARVEQGHPDDEARALFDEAISLAELGGPRAVELHARMSLVGVHARAGRLEEADALLTELRQQRTSAMPSRRAALELATAEVAAARGDRDGARAALDRAAALRDPALLGRRYGELRAILDGSA